MCVSNLSSFDLHFIFLLWNHRVEEKLCDFFTESYETLQCWSNKTSLLLYVQVCLQKKRKKQKKICQFFGRGAQFNCYAIKWSIKRKWGEKSFYPRLLMVLFWSLFFFAIHIVFMRWPDSVSHGHSTINLAVRSFHTSNKTP